MKKLKFTFFLSLIILFASLSYGQNNDNKVEPQVTVTFHTTPKINPVIEQVNILTDYDEILTEMVIEQMYINRNRNTKITSIVSDKEFNNMKEEQKYNAIKESEVIEIINLLKK